MSLAKILANRLLVLAMGLMLVAWTLPETIRQLNPLPQTPSSETTPETPESKASNEPVAKYASVAVDKECKQMVIKTSIAENAKGLAEFSAGIGKIKLLNTFNTGKSLSPEDVEKSKELTWYYSKNYVWLPMSSERYYGDKQHEDFAALVKPRNDKSSKDYAYADDLLKKVLAGVEDKHDYEFQLFILKQPGQNAMALPGGRVYLDDQLIKDRKLQDQALFAISHEVSHILQRHQTKHIQTRVLDSVDLYDAVSKVRSVQSGDNPGAVIDTLFTGKKMFTRNYIDQEMQADSCGVKLSAKAMDGDKNRLSKTLKDFINGLAINESNSKYSQTSVGKSTQNIGNFGVFVSSPIEQHPSTKERGDNLNAMYSKVN